VLRRRLLTVLAGCLVALLVVPAALGVRVHVRVEGATTTIFGAAQPLVTPFVGTLPAEGGEVELAEPTALGALEAASIRGEFWYRIVSTSFGPYVAQVGRTAGAGSAGWVYKVNGVSPPVGADGYVVEEGDEVLWYYATFGPAGGPSTLDLVRRGKRCFQAFEVNDLGERARARGVVFRLDGRRVRAAKGRICPAGHWHTLRATKPSAIRSEVIRPRR
jgi:hypothetical protein